jgi:hypothetical protein
MEDFAKKMARKKAEAEEQRGKLKPITQQEVEQMKIEIIERIEPEKNSFDGMRTVGTNGSNKTYQSGGSDKGGRPV